MTAVMDLLGAQLTLSTTDEAHAARKTVRDYTAKVITDQDLLNDIELMASEAITNALLHGAPPIEVTITAQVGSVRVEVRDMGPPARAAAQSPNGRLDHGRGLGVIASLSTRWALAGEQGATVLMFEVDHS